MALRSARAALAAVAAGFATAALAATDSLGVIAVQDAPGPGTDLAELTSQFRAVLAERTGGVVEASELRSRMMGQTSSASLSELDRAFAGALATYQAGDYEGSIRTLRAVIDDLERLPDGPEAHSQWTRAVLRLARAEQTVGRRAEADALLARLVRASPDVKVDPNQYPPSFAKQVDELKAQTAAAAKRRLTVNSSQKGAKVYVDGRDVGAAPVTVSLAPGRYRVSGRAGELSAPAVQTDLTEADQVVTLDFALAEAFRPNAGPGLALAQTDRARKIISAAAWLGLDRAVVTSLPHDGDITYLQATLYDVRKGQMQREGRLRLAGKVPPSGGLTALATFLMTGQTSALVAAAPVPLPPPPGGAEAPKKLDLHPSATPSGPMVQTAAGPQASRPSAALKWSPVVTGALALGLGGFALYESKQASDQFSKAKDMLSGGVLKAGNTPTQYNKVVSDGNSNLSTASYAGIGAGACVVATGILGYLSYKQTGEVGPFRF